jgi:hypothetical protein
MFPTPVVYILFNRADTVRRTFPLIRAQRPKRLHLIADGPRTNRPQEAERCQETRRAVEAMIDWDCEVTRDYSEVNLGCGKRLSTGLTRAFAELGEAIVLEDDILPHPDFFPYCAQQLAEHRTNPDIYAVNGFNPLGRFSPSHGPAVASVFNSIWGWASWQRAWKDYRFDLSEWTDAAVRERIRAHVRSDLIYQHYATNFDKMISVGVDTWDFQWSFTLLKLGKLAAVSSVNFIENIGFTADATHTHVAEPYFDALRTYSHVNTEKRRPMDQANRVHDKLYSEVILTPSRRRIQLARVLARSPWLQALLRSKLQ